jgi:hypothetical protein
MSFQGTWGRDFCGCQEMKEMVFFGVKLCF